MEEKMKNFLRFTKIGFIALSFSIVFGVLSMPASISADEAACKNTTCLPGTIYGCHPCNNSECDGCYRANGDQSCGVCSKGAGELERVNTGWFNFKIYKK